MSKPTVLCPHCGAEVVWSQESKWRPFCCERCKLIDLGAWADESYSVPSESNDFVEHSNDTNTDNNF